MPKLTGTRGIEIPAADAAEETTMILWAFGSLLGRGEVTMTATEAAKMLEAITPVAKMLIGIVNAADKPSDHASRIPDSDVKIWAWARVQGYVIGIKARCLHFCALNTNVPTDSPTQTRPGTVRVLRGI